MIPGKKEMKEVKDLTEVNEGLVRDLMAMTSVKALTRGMAMREGIGNPCMS